MHTTSAAFILSLDENCRMENKIHRWISSSCSAMQMSQRRESRESWSCAQLWLVALLSPSSQTAQRSCRRQHLHSWLPSNRGFLCRAGRGTPGKANGAQGGAGCAHLVLAGDSACHPQGRPSPWSASISSGYKELKGQELAFAAGLCMEPSISPIACLVLFQASIPISLRQLLQGMWSELWVWSENLKFWQIPHASGFQRGHLCRSGIHTRNWPLLVRHECFTLKIVSSAFRAGENRNNTSVLSSEHCLPLRISSNVSFQE